jgi:quinohemoprotein ethanol dehydrogenase
VTSGDLKRESDHRKRIFHNVTSEVSDMRVRSTMFLLVGGLMLSAAGVAPGQTRRIDDAALREAGRAGDDWLSYGLTPEETRYSPLDQITVDNVDRLGLAWSAEVGPGGGNQEATLLEWDSRLYGITNWSVVFAVDAGTGEELWRWDPEVNQIAVRPRICCGVVNRGLAIYENTIIAPVIDGRLIALDRDTGKPVWESRVAYPQDYYTVTMAPRIAKGKVIIGVAGAEYPVRGFFSAFDARTGEFAWRFYTVPGDPSLGFESPAMERAAETWAGEWWRLGGGGTVWDGMAYDPEADLLYVGTGNGGPWPESLRQSEGLDNLYVCSILAVRPDTGELVWYYQPVPGDSWDYDSVQHLLLADMTIDGRDRKVLMQANKNGFYYVIDRLTGAFISAQPFSYVTWASGIDQETGRPIINPEAHYDRTGEPVSVSPGPGGAHNWSPMSYNPGTGLIYVPTSTTSSITLEVDPNFEYQPGRSNTGLLRRGRGGRGGEAETTPADVEPRPEPLVPPAIGPAPEDGVRGVLVAWDPNTQTERWRAEGGGSIGGGTVTTAGNLVFQVIPDGRMVAYRADSGEKLFEVDTGLGGGMGPPITYLVDGRQYVSLMGGRGRLNNAPPGGGGGRGGDGDEGPDLAGPEADDAGNPTPKLLTFVLDGDAPIPNVAEPR